MTAVTTRPRWRRWLAGAAALAGALAPFAGSPYRGAAAISEPGRPPGAGLAAVDVAELARAVADQEDHVSAIELAGWLRDRRPGLRVIDVRSADEYAVYHIPDAEHVKLEALTEARFAPGDTIVLYSELGIHAAQAWVFLRALGHRHVVFLRNGLHDWLDDVMSPTIAADAPPEAQAAFERVAELSRSFGGTPRRIGTRADAAAADAGATAAASAAPAKPVRRRGC